MTKKFLNVSSHALTEDQMKELNEKVYEVVELSPELKSAWGSLNPTNIIEVCKEVTEFASSNEISVAMVAGQLAATKLLVEKLNALKIDSVFSYTERVSSEVKQEDGSVKKISIFKHMGFYYYPTGDDCLVSELNQCNSTLIEYDDRDRIYLEWKKSSTRECYIDKLNGKYRLDMMCFGEWYDTVEFDTIDDLINNLVNEWSLDNNMVDKVRKGCEELIDMGGRK